MFITFNGNCRQRHKCSVSSIAISAISWAVSKKQDNSRKIIFRIVLYKLLIFMSGRNIIYPADAPRYLQHLRLPW